MKMITSLREWKKIKKSLSSKSIGLVPTMGNLHQGHAHLINQSIRGNDLTIVTIFINPTQFNDKNDLAKYPKTPEKDNILAEKLGVDYLLMPKYKEIYPDNYSFRVASNTDYSKILEGAYRPNHFEGMLTIVLKLLLLISPSKIYFGEKDFQQYKLVEKMCKGFLLDVSVVCCQTVRDQNGLPLSSRNTLLSPEELDKASLFSKLLGSSLKPQDIRNQLEQEGFVIDYIEEHDDRIFGAIRFNNIRLIDNIGIKK